jgi:hypothetical protein
VTSTPSAKTFRSPYILRLIVPGQVAWDDAMTAWMNGEYVEGLAYSGETVTEVVLYVWSAGQTKLAGVAGRLGQASDWVRFGETTVSNQLTIGRGAEGVTRTWAIKGGGVNPRTGFSLPFHYHLHKYNWYKPWLWFEETPVLW